MTTVTELETLRNRLRLSLSKQVDELRYSHELRDAIALLTAPAAVGDDIEFTYGYRKARVRGRIEAIRRGKFGDFELDVRRYKKDGGEWYAIVEVHPAQFPKLVPHGE